MWTPVEVRKLIAQITGIASIIVGVLLMLNEIKAEGAVDISSEVLSGSIQSADAGMFLLFVGFFLVLVPAISKSANHIINTDQKQSPRGSVKIGPIIKLIISSIVFMIVGGLSVVTSHYLSAELDSEFSIIFGMVAIGSLAAAFISLVTAIGTWINPDFEW